MKEYSVAGFSFKEKVHIGFKSQQTVLNCFQSMVQRIFKAEECLCELHGACWSNWHPIICAKLKV